MRCALPRSRHDRNNCAAQRACACGQRRALLHDGVQEALERARLDLGERLAFRALGFGERERDEPARVAGAHGDECVSDAAALASSWSGRRVLDVTGPAPITQAELAKLGLL